MSFVKKPKKSNSLVFIAFGSFLFVVLEVLFYLSFSSNRQRENLSTGEQQRKQLREATSQLLENILGNRSNFSQLTTNPNGTLRDIDDIEEIF